MIYVPVGEYVLICVMGGTWAKEYMGSGNKLRCQSLTFALFEAGSVFCFALLCIPGYLVSFWGCPGSAFHLEANVLRLQAFITTPSFTRDLCIQTHILTAVWQGPNLQNCHHNSGLYIGSCKDWIQSKAKVVKPGKVDLIRGVFSASLTFIFLLSPQETTVPICNIIDQFHVFLSFIKSEKWYSLEV